MSRKYRQRGYMDDDVRGEEEPEGEGAVSFGALLRILACASCGERNKLPREVRPEDTCSRCGADLYACVNCEYYDIEARYECRRPLESRIEDKRGRNSCVYYTGRYSRDAQTRRPITSDDARKALDKLFPF